MVRAAHHNYGYWAHSRAQCPYQEAFEGLLMRGHVSALIIGAVRDLLLSLWGVTTPHTPSGVFGRPWARGPTAWNATALLSTPRVKTLAELLEWGCN